MKKIRVSLHPLVSNLNLPTVIKTMTLPGDLEESLFIVTQVGEIFLVRDQRIQVFLNIRSKVLRLGSAGGYDERGLLGLAFHPDFYNNGLFYLHYSLVGTQGPGALIGSFSPNPCDSRTLSIRWNYRENEYDHIDTVEEWLYTSKSNPQKQRTLLNLRRPFMNHNGVNSLNFSPETRKLILTTGDGGSGYDPFNLSQDIMEIAGKIIEIDVNSNVNIDNLPAITRFDELPSSINQTLSVIGKGLRNIVGISYQLFNDSYIKYLGNVGQDLVESVFSFINYKPIPVTKIIQASMQNQEPDQKYLINLGWRAWEGAFPTTIIRDCSSNSTSNQKIISYYNEAIDPSVNRLHPLTCYYHMDSRPDKFEGSALTGIQPYMGNDIPDLTGCLVFTDFSGSEESQVAAKGVLAYTKANIDSRQNPYGVIETNYNFESNPAYYTCLGTNNDQSKLYLGVYGSANVTDYNLGTVFEIHPSDDL